MTKMELDGSKLIEHVTLSVRMPRFLGLRFRVGALLYRLGAWVSGTTLTFRDNTVVVDTENSDGGRIVLVQYPEGFRLRNNGEVVWREKA